MPDMFPTQSRLCLSSTYSGCLSLPVKAGRKSRDELWAIHASSGNDKKDHMALFICLFLDYLNTPLIETNSALNLAVVAASSVLGGDEANRAATA